MKKKKKPPAAQINSKVQQGIDEVRDFYRIGRESLDESRDGSDYNNMLAAEARKKGMSLDKLCKARQFANLYKPSQLKKLLAGCQKHGRVIGISYVIGFLQVDNYPARQLLQEQFIEKGMSTTAIKNAIRIRQAKRGSGGRPPKLATDASGLLVQITKMCEQWRRWHAELIRPKANKKQPLEELLPAKIQDQLKQAVKNLAELGQRVDDELNRTNPGRMRFSSAALENFFPTVVDDHREMASLNRRRKR